MNTKILIFIILIFFTLLSCKTNPPTTPYITPTNSIILTLKFTQVNNVEPKKAVLLENFGNIGCNPCPIVNRIVKNLANDKFGRNKLIPIKFPTNFPSPIDIFYLAASDICDSRMNFYNILYAPAIIIDGKLKPIASDSTSISKAIESRLTQPPKFYIDIASKLDGDYLIDITIGIKDTSELDINNISIYAAVTETNITFQNPPGSGGETEFFDVIRLILPTLTGVNLRDIINHGELHYEFEKIILSNWLIENLNTIVFIQNKNSFEVYQTASTFN